MNGSQEPGACLVWLDCDHEGVDRMLVGGKGASLNKLYALGAPVPPAFALTTHAYRAFAAAQALPYRASDVNDGELDALRGRIEAAPLPKSLRLIVADGFARCQEIAGETECALAVRSSATAEDSAEFSFAGLHDTVLDVRDLASLERAIAKCWASLWSDRAVTYRRAGGIASDEAAIAVVVQLLVRSDVSFVVFTADPVNGHADHLVITASWGLGESVVAGLVVPDHIVIGPEGTVIDYVAGDKHLMVIPGAMPGEGVREVPVPRSLRSVPVLSHEQAMRIGTVARDLSSKLGYKADIEGAYSGGELHLFQVRPITTLDRQRMSD